MSIDASPLHDPLLFARQVKAASDAELDQLLRGAQRSSILDGIFFRMPDVFRADRAGQLRAVVHWHVTGPPDGADDVYEVVIAEGHCAVTAGATVVPRLSLTLDGVNFVKMTTGNAAAWTLFLRGRLKARGDLGLTKAFPNLFDVPKV